jgi:hypothetical protein
MKLYNEIFSQNIILKSLIRKSLSKIGNFPRPLSPIKPKEENSSFISDSGNLVLIKTESPVRKLAQIKETLKNF